MSIIDPTNPNPTPEETNGCHKKPLTPADQLELLFKKFGIEVPPEDTHHLYVISVSSSKGLSVQGDINDRIYTSGMLEHIKRAVDGHWDAQDLARRIEMEKAETMKQMIMGQHHRG